MSASEESLALLRSIDASLKRLVAFAERRAQGGSGGPEIAPDSDLDGAHGDPEIKAKDPRDWNGPVMKGRRMSQCPAEYLDLLAARYDFFAHKSADEGDQKKAKYARLDASRARGWAKRIRDGRVAPPPAEQAVPDWPEEEPTTQDGGW